MKVPYTRTFRVHHAKGAFKIFVTRTDLKGFFAGSVLYHNKERAGSKGDLTVLPYDLQTFVNDSEEAVLTECKEWLDQNVGSDYSLQEIYE